MRGERSGVEVRERMARGDDVAEAEPREHARRRHGPAPEDDERDDVDEHERVSQRAVDVRPRPPQPGEQAERDDEVRVVVVVGRDHRERMVRGEPAVERQLGVDSEHALEVEHAARVRERRVHAQRREVRRRVVEPAQPRDRQRLDPPARARSRGDDA